VSESAGTAKVGGSLGKAPLNDATAARLRADLVGYLTRVAGDRTPAGDLAQEAMVHAVQGLPDFRGGAKLRTWARRIAQNVWRDHLRRRAASPAERATSGEPFSVSALLDAIGPAAPALPPDDAYDRHVTHECLFAAARRLPLREREVILLHDFGTISLEQTAASLGCSVGTAKVRLHRARRRLAALCRAECTYDHGRDGTPLCSPVGAAVPTASSSASPRTARTKRRT
jgi:RNA polymerase sigma-70 factor (ECF subfamily)